MESEIFLNIEQIEQHLYIHLSISVLLWVLVVGAIMLDLWDGLYTARVLKKAIHSKKLRITVNKICEYWRLLLIGFILAKIGVMFPIYAYPFLSMLFAIGLIVVELKSMFEHAKERKSKTLEVSEIMQMIVKCASEKDAAQLIERFGEYLNNVEKQSSYGKEVSQNTN